MTDRYLVYSRMGFKVARAFVDDDHRTVTSMELLDPEGRVITTDGAFLPGLAVTELAKLSAVLAVLGWRIEFEQKS